MDIFQIQLPPEILPNLFHVNRIVNDQVNILLQYSTKSGVNTKQCNTRIQPVNNVPKAAQLRCP